MRNTPRRGGRWAYLLGTPIRRTGCTRLCSRIAWPGAAAALTAVILVVGCGTMGAPLPPDASPWPPSPSPSSSPSATPTDTDLGTGICADGLPVRSSTPPPDLMPPPGAMLPGSRMAEITKRGYLRVGVTTDAPPFGVMNWRTFELEGVDVDVARAVAEAIFGAEQVGADDKHIDLRAVTTDTREEQLSTGDVDIVVATMTITCERKEDPENPVRFSGVYYEAGFRLLVRADAGFETIRDLAGREVCSAEGSTSNKKLRSLRNDESLGSQAPVPVTEPYAADCLVALQRGEVDAVGTDNVILAGMADEDAYTEILPPEKAFAGVFDDIRVLEEPYGVAMRGTEDDEFVAFVNGVLRDFMRDGRWAASYKKWLTPVFGLEPPPPPLAVHPNWPR